ncbi:four-helix bundle copper-binding protein [Legionella clemsonensis]|uniref:four-helix bundle copper-binding protein n=1 Tax=Legionella clemsonensis TaxID=1867846 RepID=UPI001E4F1F02|nr:four-helix bundle copper-binding protein [Legionella clemsonensis]
MNRDCAAICSFAATIMARGSQFASEICRLCADICKACGDECAKHTHMEHCKRCADACYQCEDECRKMANSL